MIYGFIGRPAPPTSRPLQALLRQLQEAATATARGSCSNVQLSPSPSRSSTERHYARGDLATGRCVIRYSAHYTAMAIGAFLGMKVVDWPNSLNERRP